MERPSERSPFCPAHFFFGSTQKIMFPINECVNGGMGFIVIDGV
jgi:hypothetical protein